MFHFLTNLMINKYTGYSTILHCWNTAARKHPNERENGQHCKNVEVHYPGTCHESQRGSIGIALLPLWLVNATSRPLYPQERDPVPVLWEAGWALEPVWTGAENLALTGIRSPDRPARSESL
jgi:hypothetical protein